jgi:hypothetical protein
MPERWIANVMRKTSRLNDIRELKSIKIIGVWGEFIFVFSSQKFTYGFSQRTPNGGHFEAMREAIVNKKSSWKWENLGFVLQTPKL